MLPYGALWKLDEMLHPSAPRGRRTAAERRRQALCLFVFGVAVVSLFLVPYHVTHLRRLAIRKEYEQLGLSADLTHLDAVKSGRRERLQRLAQMFDDLPRDPTRERLGGEAAKALSNRWRHAVYFDDRAVAVPPRHLFNTAAFARDIAGLAFSRGVVPSLTGGWQVTERGAERPAAVDVWPVQTSSLAVTGGGCVRTIAHSEAVPTARVENLFARVVTAAQGWQVVDVLAPPPAVTPSSPPPAWNRLRVFASTLAADLPQDVRFLPCNSTDSPFGSGGTTRGFCVCACPRRQVAEDSGMFSLVKHDAGQLTCEKACTCG